MSVTYICLATINIAQHGFTSSENRAYFRSCRPGETNLWRRTSIPFSPVVTHWSYAFIMHSFDRFKHVVNTTYPIIQAPMLGVSNPKLAAAVSNAGGLGSIAVSSSNPEKSRDQIRHIRTLTEKPFNVNIFCHRPASFDKNREKAWLAFVAPLFGEFNANPPSALTNIYSSFVEDPAWLSIMIEERPPVVSFHFGTPPRELVSALQAEGISVFVTATTPEEAAKIEAAGADAIVAQGSEAGGHRGVFEPEAGDQCIGVMPLTRLLVKQCSIPVIASGGIMDGQGIRAAFELGASAVQMGTAFVLCPESSASPSYRAALLRATETALSVTVSGRVARGIPNRSFIDPSTSNIPPLPDYPYPYSATKALQAVANKNGNHDFDALWAGQAAPLAREMPAAELVQTLWNETNH